MGKKIAFCLKNDKIYKKMFLNSYFYNKKYFLQSEIVNFLTKNLFKTSTFVKKTNGKPKIRKISKKLFFKKKNNIFYNFIISRNTNFFI